jgi:hypothetical protein
VAMEKYKTKILHCKLILGSTDVSFRHNIWGFHGGEGLDVHLVGLCAL